MKKSERWKIWTFGGILFLVAVLINSGYDRLYRRGNESGIFTPPPPIQGIPEKTAEQLAAERAQFVATYINRNAARVAGATTVFVAVSDGDGKPRPGIATFLAAHVSSPSVHALPSAFTSSFATSGLLAETFRDAPSVISKLDLDKVADVLLLAREKTEIVRNDSSLANVLTASIELEVLAVPTKNPSGSQNWTFSAKGPGFNQSDALAAAEERIMKQITNGSAIALPISP